METAKSTSTIQTRRLFNVWYEDTKGILYEAGKDGAPETAEAPDLIMYSGQEHHHHIILDTGSKYNVISRDTKEVLYRKMKEAACNPLKVERSDQLFRFGGDSNITQAKERMKFNMNLNG